MKKIMFLFAAAVALAAVGCSKNDAASEGVQYVSELKVNFEGDTRVSATPNASGLAYSWSDGDVIYVWEDKNTEAYAKNLVYDASSGSFKPQDDRDDNKLEVGKNYFVTSSAETLNISVNNDSEGSSNVALQLKNGTGIEEYLPIISDVFTATAESSVAVVHHIVGVVEIPVKAKTSGLKLKDIKLDSQVSNTALCGYFHVSPIAPYSIYDTYGYFESSADIDTPIELSTTEATSIFIPAWVGTYSTINIVYTLENGAATTIETNHQLVVERGRITKISEFELE